MKKVGINELSGWMSFVIIFAFIGCFVSMEMLFFWTIQPSFDGQWQDWNCTVTREVSNIYFEGNTTYKMCGLNLSKSNINTEIYECEDGYIIVDYFNKTVCTQKIWVKDA